MISRSILLLPAIFCLISCKQSVKDDPVLYFTLNEDNKGLVTRTEKCVRQGDDFSFTNDRCRNKWEAKKKRCENDKTTKWNEESKACEADLEAIAHINKTKCEKQAGYAFRDNECLPPGSFDPFCKDLANAWDGSTCVARIDPPNFYRYCIAVNNSPEQIKTINALKSNVGITDCQAAHAVLSTKTEIHLSEKDLTDLTPLSGLTHVQTLSLYGNRISAIDTLSSFLNLTYLDLSKNNISDITPLLDLKIGKIDLSSNPLPDSAPVDQLKASEVIR